jgi:hypothetical protein
MILAGLRVRFSSARQEAYCEFNLSDNIIFENYANTFSNSNKKVQQSLQDLCILSKKQSLSLNPKP